MFPPVRKTCVKEMIPIIVEHLTYLGRRAEDYFSSISVDEFDWIRNPLVKLRDSSNFAMCEEKESTSFSSDRGLRMNHAELPLDAFWFFIMQEYPSIAKKAIKVLLQFSRSYVCELGFSILNNIKKRERLQSAEKELRVCLLHIRPNIAAVVQKSQAHVSH